MAGRAPIADPTGGLADLAAGLVRLCGAGERWPTIRARILRAVRLALRPDWRLDAGVVAAARAAAPALAGVAGERVRDELVRILDGPAAGRGLRLLDEMGALAALLPESRADAAHATVLAPSLRRLGAFPAGGGGRRPPPRRGASRSPPWGAEVAARFAEDLGDGLTRRGALKLAALLHDVAKPETRTENAGRDPVHRPRRGRAPRASP